MNADHNWGSITSKPRVTTDPNDITSRMRSQTVWEPEVGGLLVAGAAEIERLRGVIDAYASVCKKSEEEIRRMKDRLSSARIVYVANTDED